jgi:hypothetical protein
MSNARATYALTGVSIGARGSGWLRIGAALAAVLTSTCGSPATETGGSGSSTTARVTSTDARIKSGVFVAVAGDFGRFHSWTSYDVTGDAELAGIHDGSTVTEYVNNPPPHGSEEFPIGTIIVKEATGGTVPHELFAMVKRGGGFNAGAPGWEWFDLGLLNDGKDGTSITWRGFGPPAGDTYGGDAKAGCNTCHTECGNDAVCAKPLAFSNF